MKLLVFGATGGTGSHVVQQGLAKGFEVTAFVRDPSKLKITHPNLKIVQGDVLKPESIDKVMKGQDAVICCLGAPVTKAGTLRSAGTKNILGSMVKSGVHRFICQASLGYGDSTSILDFTPFIFRKVIVPLLLKKTFDDHLLQETFIKQSNLDWTIIRPGTLTNGQMTGNYKQGFEYTDSSLKVKISRADVAQHLTTQVSNPSSYHKVIGLSY